LRAKKLPGLSFVLAKVLGSDDLPAASYVIDLMLADPELAMTLNFANLSKVLMDPDVHAKALALCEQFPREINYAPDVVTSLIVNAQASKVATKILLSAAAAEEVSVTIVSSVSAWVSLPLPTLSWTAKLLQKVLEFAKVRETVASCPNLPLLLAQLAASGSPKLWRAMLDVANLMASSPAFVSHCANSQFLEQFYGHGMAKNDPTLLSDVISLTEALARVAYAPQYLMLLPFLQSLLDVAGWRGFAVSLLATLSLHAEARGELVGFGERLMQFSGDEQLAPYISCFLTNIPIGKI
jgi:hypothetical protein